MLLIADLKLMDTNGLTISFLTCILPFPEHTYEKAMIVLLQLIQSQGQ